MADELTKAEANDEVARLRALLEQNGIDPDTADDPDAGVVGNLADLQRLGAAAVKDGRTNIDEVIPEPPRNVEGEALAPPTTKSGKAV